MPKLWTVVTLKILSEDKEFKMTVVYDAKPLSHTTHAGDSSHSSDSPFDHLIDAYYHLEHSFLHIIDALRKFIHYNDQKSVKLKPFYHQYVRVCYHGPKPTTTFSVTLEENSKCLRSGMIFYPLL